MAIKRYYKHHEDMNMGKVNLCWGVAPNQDVMSNISHKTMVTFGQGGRTKCACLFITQLRL